MEETGYLGPPGTYCEAAALQLIQNRVCGVRAFDTIEAAITAVSAANIQSCVVPIENSLEGSVAATLDMLAHDVDLYIRREIGCSIRHNLLMKNRAGRPRVIVSHPQALAQCRRTLMHDFPEAELRPTASTAAAAMLAVQQEAYAAVASMRSAELYHLEIAAADIQDNPLNFTRFVELGREPEAGGLALGNAKTSIACRINGERPGALCELLEEFRRREVNLTRIESRPARTRLGEYIFFLDMKGSLADNGVAAAIDAVRNASLWFKYFGSYPVL